MSVSPSLWESISEGLNKTLALHLTTRTGVILEEAEYAEIAEKLTKSVEVSIREVFGLNLAALDPTTPNPILEDIPFVEVPIGSTYTYTRRAG